jgi:ABC-2 type transport system permease protein
MSTGSYAVRDSMTMLRREFRHTLRNPTTLFGSLVFPIFMLLMFTYIFGGAFDVGVEYVDYIAPGILALCVGYSVGQTAVSVSTDMREGIISRFRTMGISRASVLTARVIETVIRAMACSVIIIGVTLIMGFRPNATFVEWLAAAGVIAMISFAISWLTTAFGLVAKTAEGAAYAAFPINFLPIISSGFAPATTMPSGVRWFTDNQPFTPVIETLRGLLTGTPIGNNGLLAVIWCAVIALGSYLWARALFNRDINSASR